MSFEIRVASLDEVRLMGAWARDEGWNPGVSDPLAFAPADPGGFFIGKLDGEPVACVSAVRYGNGFGFIGFYIARPQVRGQGYGIQLWRAATEHLTGRLIGLDGVVDQQDNYRKSGFVHAWNNIRFEGTAADTRSPVEVVDARSVPFDRIAEYDRRFFPEPRDAFLATWLALPDRTARIALDGSTITGLAVRRDAQGPSRIGPLYADTPDIAAALLASVAANTPVAVDVPDANPAAVSMFQEAGFKQTFEAARMYTGPAPDLALSQMYGVTTLELG
ncbi:ribosomal protein S18 acetylase RimI-like enzyme [Actinokineospora baliensis]|uniref:GNAT family N-acetyltransferase n=1 Tax=Actinokineospora baliensis TaxID=547056 RepID=UPI00195B8139|nr:GNAT family N-acetyltransferase [Actinokineospora baliensis]MBM7773169.1 ribosomal protein S18 acetylase RimI-like enzyme [Actinokineospora baliensis]